MDRAPLPSLSFAVDDLDALNEERNGNENQARPQNEQNKRPWRVSERVSALEHGLDLKLLSVNEKGLDSKDMDVKCGMWSEQPLTREAEASRECEARKNKKKKLEEPMAPTNVNKAACLACSRRDGEKNNMCITNEAG